MIISDSMYQIMLLAAQVKIKNGESKDQVLNEYSKKVNSEQIQKMNIDLNQIGL